MAFDQRFLDELAARNDIVDVVGSYVGLQPRGSEYWGCCPFHSEKTPSFHVRPDQQMYYCFGCKKGGGVIGFIMEIENLSYPDAVRFLARRANIPVPEEERSDGTTRLRSRLLALNRDAARFFYTQLHSPEGAAAMDYLRQRRITKRNATNFGLGAAADGWDRLLNAMQEKGYTLAELLASGLVVKNPSGRAYDKFRNRLMFPIVDVRGDVLGFGGRIIDKNDKGAKYMNTPETVVYSKRRVLYGLNLAKKSKREGILLVEGNIDVVMLHQAGFDNACASMGTALTQEQLHLLSRYTKDLILCYDNDEAGKAATQKALTLLGNTDFRVRVLELPKRLVDGQYVKQDADDFIKFQGADAFENLLSGSESGMDFRMAQLAARFDLGDDQGRIGYAAAAAALLASVPSAVEREVYTVRAAETAGISAEALKLEVRRAMSQKAKKEWREQEKRDLRPVAAAQPRERSMRYENMRSALAEEGLLRLLTLDDAIFGTEMPLAESDFSSPLLGRFFTALWQQRCNGGIRIAALDGQFSADELGHLAGVLQKPESSDHAAREKALRDYLAIIRGETAKQGEDPLITAMRKRRRYQSDKDGGSTDGN
ncbi:MAG: DNA primase [Oscillospiraceae bacterium]|nr:DNA primase [Oscillospiraceae bacterium]